MSVRDSIIGFMHDQFLGPDRNNTLRQDNGEEILIEPPRDRYTLGVLYPLSNEEQSDHSDSEEASEPTSLSEEDVAIQAPELARKTISDFDNESNDSFAQLANARFPSAIGISFVMDGQYSSEISIRVNAARYIKEQQTVIDEASKVESSRQVYFRQDLSQSIIVDLNKINGQAQFPITYEEQDTGLVLRIINRTTSKTKKDIKGKLFTTSLINTLSTDNIFADNENLFFQVGLVLEASENDPPFLPYPELIRVDHADDKNNLLLYHKYHVFSAGHGCSGFWEESTTSPGKAFKLTTEIMPTYEVNPIIPNLVEGLDLQMYKLSDKGEEEYIFKQMELLLTEYEGWIDKQEEYINAILDEKYREIASKNLTKSRVCLERMANGLELLKKDNDVLAAFKLMNRAMLLQQIHNALPLRKWKNNDNNELSLEDEHINPDLSNKETWPSDKLGSWYPFQLAFILMNLASISEELGDEREIVDVIWFPTGGGKTEAYLGLTAFTIFYRRLKNHNDEGTAAIMRYTLRMLTAQQFQRASALICSCEIMRREMPEQLGNSRISIGLYVGGDYTPNNRAGAKVLYNKLLERKIDSNPFIIYKCPWCGAEMGPVEGRGREIKGFEVQRNPVKLLFRCSDQQCDFSSLENHLPIYITDEDIYETPTSLLIGTVDKFAQIVWKTEEVLRLFGRREGIAVRPPDLIIQDELHLITGPLGSMVGLFETLIEQACTFEHDGKEIKPKIIASTATISRASEQVNALYARDKDKVSVFPVQIVEAGESFFARLDRESPGRKYVGIHASARSHATTHIRVISNLLQSINLIEDSEGYKDPYWTILDYYNSLRELGHAETRIHADVKEYLEGTIFKRLGLLADDKSKSLRRFIRRYEELTSRKDVSQIGNVLKGLELTHDSSSDRAIDICMATNMISVGVDIQRLGLMTVVGQPKNSSEYIQATSRVGRSRKGPGLVFVIYNAARPRDRSHYENFYSYHQRIYTTVEPSSVTPFSIPSCHRALHAIIVGLARMLGNDQIIKSPQTYPDKELIETIINKIISRASLINPSKINEITEMCNRRFDEWLQWKPQTYKGSNIDEKPLMVSSGSSYDFTEDVNAWQTPTSMRNVDATCNIFVYQRY